MSEKITVTLPKSEYDRLLNFEKAVSDSEKYRMSRDYGPWAFRGGTVYYLITKEELEGELISELEGLKEELQKEKSKKWYQKLF